MRRILATAAAGWLLVGLAACSATYGSSDRSVATPTSPAVDSPSDRMNTGGNGGGGGTGM